MQERFAFLQSTHGNIPSDLHEDIMMTEDEINDLNRQNQDLNDVVQQIWSQLDTLRKQRHENQ